MRSYFQMYEEVKHGSVSNEYGDFDSRPVLMFSNLPEPKFYGLMAPGWLLEKGIRWICSKQCLQLRKKL